MKSQAGQQVPLQHVCPHLSRSMYAKTNSFISDVFIRFSRAVAVSVNLEEWSARREFGCPSGEAQGLGKMLSQLLVTKQTGAAVKPVNTVLVAQKLNLINEMYFAILLDRASAGPMVIACSEGGTSIEDLAETHPDKIIRMKIDVETGLSEAQARDLADRLGKRIDKRCRCPAKGSV